MASKPKLLVMDEPSTGVDIVAQEIFYELLAKFRDEQRTNMLATLSRIEDTVAHLVNDVYKPRVARIIDGD